MDKNKSWSKYSEKCISCNMADYKHHAKGLCSRCYQNNHEYPKEICICCGFLARVHKRLGAHAICSKCYKQPERICKICNKTASAAMKLNNNDFICDSCYTKNYRKKDLCSKCNKSEIIAVNSETEKICIKCYSSRNNYCNKCGRTVKSPYIIDGNHTCSRCYEANKNQYSQSYIDISSKVYNCTICGKLNSVKEVFSDGSVICAECYKARKGICHLCKSPSEGIYSHLNALPYCRSCYFKEKFIMLLNNKKALWAEEFYEIFESYFIERSKYVTYESICNCLEGACDIFNELNKKYSENQLHFSMVDLLEMYKSFPTKRVIISDIISFLHYKKLLLDYENSLNLVNGLNTLVNELPVEMRKSIELYKKWILSRSAKFKERGWVDKDSRFNLYTCYLYLLTAIRFLNYLYNDLNLIYTTQIDNSNVDSYLSEKSYEKGNLRHFIKFLNSNKLIFVRLTLPNSNYTHELHIGLDEIKQKHIFNLCLDEKNNIPLQEKVLILLMLIFGLTPNDIRNLKKENFIFKKVKSKQTLIYVRSKSEVKIPSIMSKMLIEYLDTSNRKGGYIFPGRLYNKPLSQSSICRIISKFNTTATELHYTAINNAMLNGLTQPTLLTKLFGISPATAARYYKFIEGSMDF